MAKTIGNPLSWTARSLGAAGDHVAGATAQLGGEAQAMPEIRRLGRQDLVDALKAGWDDFLAFRTDVMFLVLIYPVIGLVLMGMGLRMELLPMLFPLVSGFALIGPVAAVGLYELSRRREAGEKAGWLDAFAVLRSPSFGAILALGFYLVALFVLWMVAAGAIYDGTMGPEPPVSIAAFAGDLFTTNAGASMVLIGVLVGALFAVLVLAMSVVSFPLLLDRRVGVPVAVVTSLRVFAKNPVEILTWGGIVACGLVLGALPMLLGLIVVLPVLGHATWHLYRRAVT